MIGGAQRSTCPPCPGTFFSSCVWQVVSYLCCKCFSTYRHDARLASRGGTHVVYVEISSALQIRAISQSLITSRSILVFVILMIQNARPFSIANTPNRKRTLGCVPSMNRLTDMRRCWREDRISNSCQYDSSLNFF
jgi:hypothetical protein